MPDFPACVGAGHGTPFGAEDCALSVAEPPEGLPWPCGRAVMPGLLGKVTGACDFPGTGTERFFCISTLCVTAICEGGCAILSFSPSRFTFQWSKVAFG